MEGGWDGREYYISSSDVHTREVMLIVCVSILPGPVRVKVPSPPLLNLSLELSVVDLHVSSLKVKRTSKRRKSAWVGERGGEGDRPGTHSSHSTYNVHIHVLNPQQNRNMHCTLYLSVHPLPLPGSRQSHSLGTYGRNKTQIAT